MAESLSDDDRAMVFGGQLDVVEIWVRADSAASPTARTFIVVGTGHVWPEDVKQYVGTAVTPNGALVWHLLELKRVKGEDRCEDRPAGRAR